MVVNVWESEVAALIATVVKGVGERQYSKHRVLLEIVKLAETRFH